ncbi:MULTISPECIES: ion channel protein [unclassified Microbacterium]|uniref:ion channel protein n=1 Tax=unclassified Microbacterium TaxID=2609290 RepID=UPI0006FCD3DB|nr:MULTISPECIES: ion channel protein [unclassified Microbacterium]KQP74259.1 ion channel protein [Microbacterium sp. Leaf288]MDT0144383.1 ion channel protein [Microbacterium sp. PRC9]
MPGPSTASPAPATPPGPQLTVRRLVLLSIPAILIGVLSALSLRAVDLLADQLDDGLWTNLPKSLGIASDSPWWIFAVLTFTGIAVGLVVWLVPGHAGPDSATTELAATPLQLSVLPGLAVVVILSLAGGVSLGPENPIIAINVSLAVAIIARISKAVPPALIGALAISATIGALFGTPVAAALVFTGMVGEFKMGGSLWDKLFLPLVAAGAGSVTTYLLGGGFGAQSPFDPYGSPQPFDLLTGSLIACGAAAFGLVGIYLFPLVHRAFHALRHPLLFTALGGVVLGLLGAIGGPITLFKGLDQSAELLADPDAYPPGQLTIILLVKMAALVVAASAGFRGGRIFPAVFLGVAAGLLGGALLPGLPLSLAVACGILGVVLAIARDGWVALFVAVALVDDITVLPMLCIIVLPTWLVVTRARDMLITPDDLARERTPARLPWEQAASVR